MPDPGPAGAAPIVMVLAGGRATRMGEDKALRRFAGTTLLAHVLSRLAGHRIIVNANGDPARLARFGLPVLADSVPGYPGPLAGVLAGMEWTQTHARDTEDLVTVPTDTPFLPTDLVTRLIEARAGADLACAVSAGRAHPLCALWPVRLAPRLRQALTAENLHRVDHWTARFSLALAEYPATPFDPFLNINTPADLAAAEALLADGTSYMSVPR